MKIKKWDFVALLMLFSLAFGVQTTHSSTFCLTREYECYHGWDVNTYVALTENGSYIDPDGRLPILLENEHPLAIWAMRWNPLRLADEYLAYHASMLMFSLASGILVYLLVCKLAPGNEIYATAIWLFNPLNYRLFMDLTQNMFANMIGIGFLCWLAYREDLEKRGTPWLYIPFLLPIMLLTHQFALWWLIIIGALAVFGTKRWKLVMLLAIIMLLAGIASQPRYAWRFALMLAFPMTMLLTHTPKIMRFFVFACLVIAYWLTHFFFIQLNATKFLH